MKKSQLAGSQSQTLLGKNYQGESNIVYNNSCVGNFGDQVNFLERTCG